MNSKPQHVGGLLYSDFILFVEHGLLGRCTIRLPCYFLQPVFSPFFYEIRSSEFERNAAMHRNEMVSLVSLLYR
jgi:hypothetical protein